MRGMSNRILRSIGWICALVVLMALGAFAGALATLPYIQYVDAQGLPKQILEDHIATALFFGPTTGGLAGVAATGGLRWLVRLKKSHH